MVPSGDEQVLGGRMTAATSAAQDGPAPAFYGLGAQAGERLLHFFQGLKRAPQPPADRVRAHCLARSQRHDARNGAQRATARV